MSTTLTAHPKSRDLSPLEYLEALQLEYVVAQLRRKTYAKPKDKKHYDVVMEAKKTKIENIARRNTLKTIFTDPDIKAQVEDQVYRSKGGLPDYHYRNESQRIECESKDFAAYFAPHQEVQVYSEDGMSSIGVLVEANEEKQIALVRLKGHAKPQPVSVSNIARIL